MSIRNSLVCVQESLRSFSVWTVQSRLPAESKEWGEYEVWVRETCLAIDQAHSSEEYCSRSWPRMVYTISSIYPSFCISLGFFRCQVRCPEVECWGLPVDCPGEVVSTTRYRGLPPLSLLSTGGVVYTSASTAEDEGGGAGVYSGEETNGRSRW